MCWAKVKDVKDCLVWEFNTWTIVYSTSLTKRWTVKLTLVLNTSQAALPTASCPLIHAIVNIKSWKIWQKWSLCVLLMVLLIHTVGWMWKGSWFKGTFTPQMCWWNCDYRTCCKMIMCFWLYQDYPVSLVQKVMFLNTRKCIFSQLLSYVSAFNVPNMFH